MSTTYNPLQPGYTAQAPQGQATMSTANVSPQASIQQVLQGFQPQAQQSTSDLNSTLAAMGIVGGGAQQAQTMLQGQLASSLAPTLASVIQNSQGMGLQQSLANASANNQMTGLNIQDILGTNMYNTSAYNNAQSQLANYINQGWQLPYEANTQIQTGGLGAAGSISTGAAQDYPVTQPQTLLGSLGI